MILDIVLSNGTPLTLDNSYIISSSYKSDSSSSMELNFGFASSSSLDFSLIDIENNYQGIVFDNAVITMYNNDRTVKKGVFNVRSVVRRKDTINFSCLDNMYKFDKRYIDEDFSGTVGSLLYDICNYCGVLMGNTTSSFLHNTITIPNSEPFLNMNCREILQAICECAGCYAIMNEDGELELKWYDLSTIKQDILYQDLFDIQREDSENNITDISGVIAGKEFRSYNVAPTGYELIFGNNNPIIYNHTELEIQDIFNDIKQQRLQNFNYYTLQFTTRTNWALNIGDTIRVQDRDNNYYKAIITSITYNNDNGMTVISSGENKERNYNDINNKDSKAYGGTFLFGHNTSEDETTYIVIDNVVESSQVLLNISDNNLQGSVSITLNDTVIKTITTNSYSFVLPIETTLGENELEITGRGVSDLSISLVCVNCEAYLNTPVIAYATLKQYVNGLNNLGECTGFTKELIEEEE